MKILRREKEYQIRQRLQDMEIRIQARLELEQQCRKGAYGPYEARFPLDTLYALKSEIQALRSLLK